MKKEVEKLLQYVQKPARYIGGELNAVVKDKEKVDIRYAFCFPDTYEIGMSHLGMKILYGLVNDRDDSWCERVFAPDNDMEEQLRKNNVPLFALESGDYIKDFDMIGFTLQYELSYTNILNMLNLAQIPLKSSDRESLTPLICVGGPCACNPEPITDFVDIVFLGDGEETTNQIIDLLIKAKKNGLSKHEFLLKAKDITGIYVPSFYKDSYNDDGTLKSLEPLYDAPKKVKKAVVSDMNSVYYPKEFVVPYATGCFMFFRGEVFRKLKGFDDNFFMYLEDADITKRTNEISSVVFYPYNSVVHFWQRGSHNSLHLTLVNIKSMFYYFSKWGWKFM